SKKEALNYIKERILGKVQGWKQKHLSQAGKETLIKAVLFAIPSYPMSCFKLPITLCREIDSLIANF
ncbi:PREDICTED: reverse mRNAase, partial [Prunus dulcis]